MVEGLRNPQILSMQNTKPKFKRNSLQNKDLGLSIDINPYEQSTYGNE